MICTLHGLSYDEHVCLSCCLCFKSIMISECNIKDDGSTENVCKPCAKAEEKEGQRRAKVLLQEWIKSSEEDHLFIPTALIKRTKWFLSRCGW